MDLFLFGWPKSGVDEGPSNSDNYYRYTHITSLIEEVTFGMQELDNYSFVIISCLVSFLLQRIVMNGSILAAIW